MYNQNPKKPKTIWEQKKVFPNYCATFKNVLYLYRNFIKNNRFTNT